MNEIHAKIFIALTIDGGGGGGGRGGNDFSIVVNIEIELRAYLHFISSAMRAGFEDVPKEEEKYELRRNQ